MQEINVKTTRLVTEVDNASVNKAKKANSELELSFSDLGSAAESVAPDFDAARKKLDALTKAHKKVKVGANSAVKTLKGESRALRGLASDAEKAERAVESLSDRNSRLRRDAGELGDLGGSSRAVGAAVGTLSGNEEVARAASVLAEIPDGIEGIIQVGGALPAVAASASAALTTTAISIGGVTIALGPLLLALLPVAIGVAVATKELNKYKTAINSSIEAERRGIEARQLTSEEIEANREELLRTVEVQREATQGLVESQEAGREGHGILGAAFTQFVGLNKQVKTANEELNSMELELNELDKALASGAVAANDKAAATERETAALLASSEARAKFEVRIEAATAERLDAELEGIFNRRREIEKEIEILRDSGVAAEQLAARMTELNEELAQLGESAAFIREQAREVGPAAADAVDNLEELEQALRDAEKEEENRLKAVERVGDQVVAAEQNAAARRESIAVKQAQRLEDLAIKTAQAETDALTKLREKRSDAALGLERDFADDRRQQRIDERQGQIEFQRGEVESAIEHAQRLGRIRLDANRDEEDLIRNRDFAGLARARRDTSRKLDDESKAFNDGRKERLREFSHSQIDSRNAFIQQREQRIIEFNQQLVDIQAQAKREAQQRRINIARRQQEIALTTKRELEALNKAHGIKLAMLADLLQKELDLVAQAAGAVSKAKSKVKVEASKPSSGASASEPEVATGGGSTSSAPPPVALLRGGRLGAGQVASINEDERPESFTPDVGRPFRLPAGRGEFAPARSGRVNPADDNAGGVNLTIPLTVIVNDKRAILRTVMRDLEQVIQGI